MTARTFTFAASGYHAGGAWDIKGAVEGPEEAGFVDGVQAALTAMMAALRDEYPGCGPFRITALTIEQRETLQ